MDDAGIAVLRGNLAPRGAIIKPSAATPALLQHVGPAVVFDSVEDMRARIDDPDLDVTADSVLVLRGCGPRGYPGMPEVGQHAAAAKLLEQGVRDMVRISDARMSGTAYGTVILHVAPEAAAGGPLAFVRTGDIVTVDVENRILQLRRDRRGAAVPQPGARERGRLRRAGARLGEALRRPRDAGRHRCRPRLPGRARAATRSAVSRTDAASGTELAAHGCGARSSPAARADSAPRAPTDCEPTASTSSRSTCRPTPTTASTSRMPPSIAAAVAAVGPVDILINSAGIVGPNAPLCETDPAAWERTFDVNVHGTFRVIQAVVPGMVERGWGRIVNIASMAGKDGNPNLSAYSASKAAVIGLTKSLGKELAKTGVLVNVDRAGRDRHPDERDDRAGRARAHHLADPDGPGRPGRGGRRARRVAHLRRVQLLDRRRLRHQRRPGDLLGRCPHAA